MTVIHDVLFKDYGARIAECEGKEKFTTPFLIDFKETEPLPFSIPERAVPESLKNFIPGMYEYLISKYPQRSGDLEVLAGIKALEKEPKKIAEMIIRKRSESGYATVLYAPYIATPENVSLLIYLGIDVVDNLVCIIEASQGNYLTSDGSFPVESIDVLPCNCTECRNASPEDFVGNTDMLFRHNTHTLERELAIVRFHIKKGSIRQYVEKQSRTSPYLTALLRFADQNFYGFFEERTPVYKRAIIYPTSYESFRRVEFTRFLERAVRVHRGEETLLLLPCSARKPYLLSKTHRIIEKALPRTVYEIIISSPLVVPRELEVVYPAMHYDTPVTGEWTTEEIEFVSGYLKRMIEGREYSSIIAHVDGGYRKVVERLEDLIDIEVTYTAEGGVLSSRSLRNLAETIGEGKSINRFRHLIEGMLEYQFGEGAGDLIEGRVRWRGRYPSLVFFENDIQIGVINPSTGSISISKEFAVKLIESGRNTVEIEEFIPRGTIFAGGIISAHPDIRPGDEVVFHNGLCYGVGKAGMSGKEMMEMEHGTAIKVRHVIKETLS